MSNTFGGTLISAFDYANDSLGRRTARLDDSPVSSFQSPVTNSFGYNARSEVQSALMGTNTYGYAYDPIGNRLVATNNAVATAYLVNELNQYTNIVLEGEAPSEPIHDDDGNLVSNGEWAFTWDGENRLLSASNATTLVTYAHDFQSRRVGRKQFAWDTDHWTLTTDHRFLYDGWALIREVVDSGSGSATNHFVYGLDLSGSLQGAGTIGGILSANLDGATVLYGYDSNGNVTDLVDTNGEIRAHYEYDAFGNVTAQSGDLATTNPFRFSTKRQDEATGLLYYGYRDLDTVWGRWASRDPIGERGGLLLHGFVGNQSIGYVDTVGRQWFAPPGLPPGGQNGVPVTVVSPPRPRPVARRPQYREIVDAAEAVNPPPADETCVYFPFYLNTGFPYWALNEDNNYISHAAIGLRGQDPIGFNPEHDGLRVIVETRTDIVTIYRCCFCDPDGSIGEQVETFLDSHRNQRLYDGGNGVSP